MEMLNSRESKSPDDFIPADHKFWKEETGKSLEKSKTYPGANTKKEISHKMKPSSLKMMRAISKSNWIWSSS